MARMNSISHADFWFENGIRRNVVCLQVRGAYLYGDAIYKYEFTHESSRKLNQ